MKIYTSAPVCFVNYRALSLIDVPLPITRPLLLSIPLSAFATASPYGILGC